MCLAIPACIESIGEGNIAQVDILGVKRDAALDLTPQAQVGDYVLVHAGFAIEVIDTQQALETLELVKLLDAAAFSENGVPFEMVSSVLPPAGAPAAAEASPKATSSQ